MMFKLLLDQPSASSCWLNKTPSSRWSMRGVRGSGRIVPIKNLLEQKEVNGIAYDAAYASLIFQNCSAGVGTLAARRTPPVAEASQGRSLHLSG
jgi:hypothetical protein